MHQKGHQQTRSLLLCKSDHSAIQEHIDESNRSQSVLDIHTPGCTPTTGEHCGCQSFPTCVSVSAGAPFSASQGCRVEGKGCCCLVHSLKTEYTASEPCPPEGSQYPVLELWLCRTLSSAPSCSGKSRHHQMTQISSWTPLARSPP